MGEVLLAYDPRLDRRVAIKHIRSDILPDPKRRARLRREARLAAGLNHPAIVAVHDLLIAGDHEYIVMEDVEGRTLRDLLADRGSVSVAKGLRIAIAIAEGLTVAHQAGVIHRDLKSENILVTLAGQVKITDFGIARSLSSGAAEAPLTGERAVIGTSRAMSPEQMRGQSVEARSDLFSLGVLLYELWTGRSPFQAEDHALTAARVLREQQPAAINERPELPQPLSELIDQLLEKDPLLRPRDAAEVVERLHLVAEEVPDETDMTLIAEAPTAGSATLSHNFSVPHERPSERHGTRRRWLSGGWTWIVVVVLALVASAVSWLPSMLAKPPLYVAVLEPELQSAEGDEMAYAMAFAVRSGLMRSLVAFSGVVPKTATEIDAVSGTPQQIARAVAADEILVSSMLCFTSGCQIELRRVKAADGAVVWTGEMSVTADPLTVARALDARLREAYRDWQPSPEEKAFEISSEDYASYLKISELGQRGMRADKAALIEQLAAIRQRAPRFSDVYLLEADLLGRRFYEARDPLLLRRAFDLVALAKRLAPEDLEVGFTELYLARLAKQPERAARVLAWLEKKLPGDIRVLEGRAWLLEQDHDVGGALALYRQAAERLPSWKILYNYAALAARQGEVDEARESLEEVLDLSPKNVLGRSLLAQLELTHGDAGRAVRLYEGLVVDHPGPAELSNLGLARMLLGDFVAAARAFERVVEDVPENPLYLLNLADARWLAGHVGEAEALYRDVVERLDGAAAGDDWQALTVLAQAQAHLRQDRQAVAATQQALALAPNDAQVAFEAALVYALVGDRTAALVNAERALDLGWEPRWLELPWFDDLRSSVNFSRLSAGPALPRAHQLGFSGGLCTTVG